MEYVPGGEFFTHLRNATMLPNSAAQFYAAQVTLMFEYLHDRDIIYRDVRTHIVSVALCTTAASPARACATNLRCICTAQA